MQDDMPYESEFVQLTSTPRKAERPSYMCFRNANLRTASFPKILVIFFIWRFLMLFLFFTKLTTSFTRLYLFKKSFCCSVCNFVIFRVVVLYKMLEKYMQLENINLCYYRHTIFTLNDIYSS